MKLGGGYVKLGQELPLETSEGEAGLDLLEHRGIDKEEGLAIAPLVVSADGFSGRTRMNRHLVIVFLVERKVSFITFLEAEDVDVGVNGGGLTQQSRSGPWIQPFVIREGPHSCAGLRWSWLWLVGSRRSRSHGLARRDIRIPWWVAKGRRVGPTSFRRRVLKRWRRVWSDFGASHQKSCKENEKGRDESLKTEGPNRKGEDREDKGGS